MKRLIVALLLTLLLPVSSVDAAVNDFEISNYNIQYTLGRDDEQRSTLKTVETITAEFPDYDQNHGIERAIPQSYDDHPTHLKIESVTKQDGSKWN